MTDPGTIGAITASALAMTGEIGLKTVVGVAVKDAYEALKNRVRRWAPSEVNALEKSPAWEELQVTLGRIIDGQSAKDKAAVRSLANELIGALKHSPIVGLDIGRLDALEVQIGAIMVAEGIGVRIGEAEVAGKFSINKVTVGRTSGKP
jgi:hypothetical protein